MKKLLLILLFAVNTAYSDTLTVVTPWPVGTLSDQICRTVFKSYEKLYNTNVIILNMPGADHVIAHRHLLTLREPAILCAGTSVYGVNQLEHQTSPPVDSIKPLNGILSYTTFVIVPSDRPDSWEGFLQYAKNRKVIVGGPSTHSVRIISYMLDKHNIKYDTIVYKKPFDAMVDMTQGTLDLYIEGGTVKQQIDGGNQSFKEIAHMSIGTNKSSSPNIIKLYPMLKHFGGACNLFAPATMSDSEVSELNQRVNKAIAYPDSQKFFKEVTPYHTPNNGTVKEFEYSMRQYQQSIKNVYN